LLRYGRKGLKIKLFLLWRKLKLNSKRKVCCSMNSASEFGKDLGLMHEVVVTGRKAGFTSEDWAMLAHDESKIRQVLDLIRGNATLQLDSMICVDRSVRPTYPDWVRIVMHPDLENVGPSEFDAAKLELWLHDDQKGLKWIKGQVIYEYLKEKKMLENCLGLSDLIAIQAKGIDFFRRYLAGKAVFAWKSVVRNRNGYLNVPYLCERGDKVVLNWIWLDNDWGGNSPALCFAS